MKVIKKTNMLVKS